LRGEVIACRTHAAATPANLGTLGWVETTQTIDIIQRLAADPRDRGRSTAVSAETAVVAHAS
jgi:hypothetical protein